MADDGNGTKNGGNGGNASVDVGQPPPPAWALGVKSVGGLAAVVSGIVALVVIAIVAMIVLGFKHSQGVTAIATGSFTAIATIVGTYFGVKIGTDGASKALETTRQAHEALAGAAAASNTTAGEEPAEDDEEAEPGDEDRLPHVPETVDVPPDEGDAGPKGGEQ